jgi:hypothetical protein
LLDSVGRSFEVWRAGRWQTVRGWSEPRAFAFPAPVGSRIGYLVDVPAHDSFVPLFRAARVEFRVGSELRFLNGCVSAASRVVAMGLVRSLVPWTPLLRSSMAAFGSFGSEAGGVGVEIEGLLGNRNIRRRASIVAAARGQVIPVMPATIMVARWLTAPHAPSGIVPLDRWVRRSELEIECERRGFQLIIEEEEA